MHRYVKISQLIAEGEVDDAFLRMLEAEDLIHPKRTAEDDRVISAEDAERVRVVRLLTGELEVNLAGVEVIIHMRETMRAMQRQFCEILDALVDELHRRGTPR
jgi:MerR family transcriptional regulator/heat shock protein HspR